MLLIILCAAALLGIALGDLGRLEPRGLVFGALVALLGACLAWRQPMWRGLALAACALAAGGVRASLVEPRSSPTLEAYSGQVLRLRGTLLEPPAESSSGTSVRFPLEVHAISQAGSDPPAPPSAPRAVPAPARAAAGQLMVIGAPAAFGQVLADDEVVLEGRVLAGQGRAPPTLSFPRLLEHTPAQLPGPLAWLANLRSKAAAGIHRSLPEPQASLSTGLLLGGPGQLDADFRLQLQRSGLAHLVAIDGYKQVIVAAALGGLSVHVLGARLATLPIVLGIAAYTLLTGAHPSAVRAALMVGLASVASTAGRVADPLSSLLLAVLAMAGLDPPILLDVGLQLSLSATLGIVLLWPRVRRRLRGTPSFIAEPAGLTLAVTLATLPLTLSVFQSVSLVSPLAHIAAVPLLPIALASTAGLAAVSALEPLASAVAWLAWLPSTLLVEVIRFFGSLPGAALSTGRLPTHVAVGLAAGLLAWGVWGLPEAAGLRLWWARLRLRERRWSLPAACVCAGLAAVALLQLVRPDGRLHVQALGAGRGEAVFIRGPTGRTALVVGGRVDGSMLAAQVADRLAVWEHALDRVVRLDAAAEAGLGPTLARYPAEQRSNADQDQRIDLGGGAVLDVYAESEPDSQSTPRAAVSFGSVWLPLPRQAEELVSDGTALWAASDDGQRS
jgi:competence protein ComEC